MIFAAYIRFVATVLATSPCTPQACDVQYHVLVCVHFCYSHNVVISVCRAVVLEMIGDLPEADVKPPSNMLFVCKLNPVTTEEDLEIIFGR